MPLLDYCDVVWCPTTVKFTSVTERVHSKIIKKIPLSISSFALPERRRYHTVLQVFKSMHKFSPSYLQDILKM